LYESSQLQAILQTTSEGKAKVIVDQRPQNLTLTLPTHLSLMVKKTYAKTFAMVHTDIPLFHYSGAPFALFQWQTALDFVPAWLLCECQQSPVLQKVSYMK